MIDREKVIKGLELCTSGSEYGDNTCQECPYFVSVKYGCHRQQMEKDALELLKEQEAKPLRCKECSYHRDDGWCNEHRREVKEADYCSFGAWEGR